MAIFNIGTVVLEVISSCRRCLGVLFSLRWIFSVVWGATNRHIFISEIDWFFGFPIRDSSCRTGSLAFLNSRQPRGVDTKTKMWPVCDMKASALTCCLSGRVWVSAWKCYKNHKKCLTSANEAFSSWVSIFPSCRMETKLCIINQWVEKDFQAKFENKDQRLEPVEGFRRRPG